MFIIEPAATTAGAIRVVRGLEQNHEDDLMTIDVLVANMDVNVKVKKGGLIATATECDYERPADDKHLVHYQGSQEVDLTKLNPDPGLRTDPPNVASVKSYKE